MEAISVTFHLIRGLIHGVSTMSTLLVDYFEGGDRPVDTKHEKDAFINNIFKIIQWVSCNLKVWTMC